MCVAVLLKGFIESLREWNEKFSDSPVPETMITTSVDSCREFINYAKDSCREQMSDATIVNNHATKFSQSIRAILVKIAEGEAKAATKKQQQQQQPNNKQFQQLPTSQSKTSSTTIPATTTQQSKVIVF